MAAASLKVIVDHRVIRELPLQAEFHVGRRPDNDLVLDDPSVSARHGCFRCDAGRWTYTDLGSSHGSLVAAGPQLGAGEHVLLEDVTQILLGDTVLEFAPCDDSPTVRAADLLSPAVGAEVASGATTTSDRVHAPPPPASAARPAADDTAQRRFPGPSSAARATSSAADAGVATTSLTDQARVMDTHRIEGLPERALGGSARLLVVIGDQTQAVDLIADETVLGRSSRCDLVIDHASVSARHAAIRRVGDSYLIEDLGSTNGTRLGLVRLTGPQELSPNTHLILGGADLLFLHDGKEGQRPLDPAAFLRWLKSRRKLTRQQLRHTLDRHAATGRSVEELLVSDGMLKPGELTELRHNALARLAAGGAGSGRATALWLWVAVTLVGAAVAFVLLG